MSDELFPSGLWTGFYNYTPENKHRTDVDIRFTGGQIAGLGVDDLGRFIIKGTYDVQSLECSWVKTYAGAHSVSYRGFREGKGIWGTWEITRLVEGKFGHGGFHIWPAKETDETSEQAVNRSLEEGDDEIELRRPPFDHD